MKRKDEKSEAILLWVAMMASYLAAGLLQRYWLGFSLVIWVNLIFLGICCGIAAKKDEGMRSLGFHRERFLPSCAAGAVCSVVIVLLNAVIPAVISGGEPAPLSGVVYRLFYFMIFISIPEEVIFRGYIWNALEKGKKSRYGPVIVSGVLFMLLHIPYRAVMSGGLLDQLLNGFGFTLLMTFVWHLVFCAICKKTGGIYGAILFHGVMDWSNYLFLF